MEMRCWIVLGFGLICVHSINAADARWTRIATPNFEMYTTAGERSARDTIRYFEQVHSFFEQSMPKTTAKASQVHIVAFNSEKEYAPYRLNEFATAYYHATADRDYIVMSHTGSETFPTAIHEYVHLITQHSNLKLPPWLSEGVAELYSTLKPMGSNILVGSLIPGRFQALQMEKWVPLATIMGAAHDSAYYNEKNKAGSLYNEGWALTHMLALTNEYRAKFTQLMVTISNGTPSADALEQTYGKPLSRIEADLQSYLRGSKFQGVLIPAKLEKMSDELKAEPADDFDVALLLAQISERPGKEDAARSALEALVKRDPKRSEPYLDLGYLDWRQNQTDAARENFAKAYDLGSRSPRMMWDYGRMAESKDSPKSIAVLGELLKLDANRLEVRLELASVQLRAKAAKDALATLAPVKTVTPEDAPKLLSLLAYSNLEVGDREKARNAAEQWKKVSKDIEDQDRADQLLRFIASSQAGAQQNDRQSAVRSAPVLGENHEAPVLRRRDVAEEVAAKPVVRRPTAAGKFVELQCVAEKARMVLATAEGKKILLIDDPLRLTVIDKDGQSGGTMDLNCGPQKAIEIRIDYDLMPANSSKGLDGLVRVIHFEP